MRKLNIWGILRQKLQQHFVILLVTSMIALTLTSCQEDLLNNILNAGPLALTASKSTLELKQKDAKNTAVNLTWTTGTNHESGASISYILQVDKKGNNFSKAISQDMGKGIYSKNFSVEELNDSLLTRWAGTPGSATELEARVISTVYSTPSMNDTSAVVTISATPYQPVSKTLYIIGDASPKGWNTDNALALSPQSDPTIFVYQGALNVGSFKLLTTSGQFLPSYNKGADNSHIVLRTLDSQADDKFSITEAAVYKITVSLLDLTITVAKVDLPAYNTIYMVGDATPNGWDIGNATPLVQNASNPFLFSYTGVMKKGDFKFPVNRNTDWGQDMFMKVDDTHMYLHHGGASDDSKWSIAKKGYYTITLNLLENSITINREKLYMVGDATPIGWTITNAVEMTEDATDGCIFTYNGPMVAGAFKFPVNRDSSWGQDMYMRTDDTHMYRHIGGQSDDNKWTISAEGNYLITANIETLSIGYVKQ
jgi:starch-binding outer membrane protein SusE/F